MLIDIIIKTRFVIYGGAVACVPFIFIYAGL